MPNSLQTSDIASIAMLNSIARSTVFCYTIGSKSFSDHVPFVGPVLSTCTTLFQVKSMCQISFDQKFGKSELTQMQHEENGCDKVL